MKPLQAKLSKYTAPQEAKAAGIYPYFRAISSEQDPEVTINGRRVLMFGSNCYTGLVNDPASRKPPSKQPENMVPDAPVRLSSTVLSIFTSSLRPESPSI